MMKQLQRRGLWLWGMALMLSAALPCIAQAQDAAPDTTVRVLGLPILFYTPDTRLGLGAAGVLSFRGSPLRSSITFSVAYTLRRQFLLWLPYQWFGKRGRYRAFGEVGWFRYLYQYFGTGNAYPNTFIEKYTAEYPRLRLTALARIGAEQYAGLRLGMDNYRILEREVGGELEQGRLAGADGGLSSSLGAAWLLDSRNSPFFPTQGWLVDLSASVEAPAVTGSDFRYSRLTADAAHYRPLGAGGVLALHALADLTRGQAPFFLLPALGGTRKLRGYPDGKFRDANMALLQAEWRVPLFWRFKAALFAGLGAVWGRPDEPFRLRPNGGGGLRFELDPQQHIHIRADYGFGQGASGFYLTVGEAF